MIKTINVWIKQQQWPEKDNPAHFQSSLTLELFNHVLTTSETL